MARNADNLLEGLQHIRIFIIFIFLAALLRLRLQIEEEGRQINFGFLRLDLCFRRDGHCAEQQVGVNDERAFDEFEAGDVIFVLIIIFVVIFVIAAGYGLLCCLAIRLVIFDGGREGALADGHVGEAGDCGRSGHATLSGGCGRYLCISIVGSILRGFIPIVSATAAALLIRVLLDNRRKISMKQHSKQRLEQLPRLGADAAAAQWGCPRRVEALGLCHVRP